jgi:hypothetical protein
MLRATTLLLAALLMGGAAGARSPAVCYEILGSWWGAREEQIRRGVVNDWDRVCVAFKGLPTVCNVRGAARAAAYELVRAPGAANLTAAQADTPCNTLGAHSDKCIGNICNSYNTGLCTLQGTAGLCLWHTKEDAVAFGVEFGCHRNPCHRGGEGKIPAARCAKRGVPGLVDCVYCKGPGDKLLAGKGMGCQRAQAASRAQCAPVNHPDVDRASIWWKKAEARCQCSDNGLFCVDELRSTNSAFSRRFPGAG